MAKPGYFGMKLSPEIVRLLDAICRHLHLTPGARGAYMQAIVFALRHTVEGLGLDE